MSLVRRSWMHPRWTARPAAQHRHPHPPLRQTGPPAAARKFAVKWRLWGAQRARLQRSRLRLRQRPLPPPVVVRVQVPTAQTQGRHPPPRHRQSAAWPRHLHPHLRLRKRLRPSLHPSKYVQRHPCHLQRLQRPPPPPRRPPKRCALPSGQRLPCPLHRLPSPPPLRCVLVLRTWTPRPWPSSATVCKPMTRPSPLACQPLQRCPHADLPQRMRQSLRSLWTAAKQPRQT